MPGFLKRLFCRHVWSVLDQREYPSLRDQGIYEERQLNEERGEESLKYDHEQLIRMCITYVTCEKCGKFKRLVEEHY